MRITVNPAQEASGDFGYAEAGEYTLRIVKCEQMQKQGSPNPYLKWTMEFADANTPATEVGKKVGQIFENTTLKPDAQFGLRDLCDALGLTWGDFDTDETIGVEFQAKVKIHEYDGKLSNEIGKFIPVKK